MYSNPHNKIMEFAAKIVILKHIIPPKITIVKVFSK